MPDDYYTFTTPTRDWIRFQFDATDGRPTGAISDVRPETNPNEATFVCEADRTYGPLIVEALERHCDALDDGGLSPTVVIVRDPDYENAVTTFGEVEVHDIDLGRADLSDPDELTEWAASHMDDSRKFRRVGKHDVADFIEETVDETKANA
jgi:hypothetical protein